MGMGRILACIAVFFWGAAYIWGKITMTWLSPLETATARFAFGAIILLVLILFVKKPKRSSLTGHWWHYFLLGFIGITCFQASLFFAISVTSPINVAVIMALSPVFTAIAEAIVSKEMPSIHTVIAIIISVGGATLAVLGSSFEGSSNLSLNWGDTVAIFSALCFTFYTVASRRWLPGHITSLINTTIVVTIGAILLLPLTFALSPMPKLPISWEPVWSLVGLVIGATVIAYICWTQAIERIGVTEPNLIYNFMPLVTMILSSFHGAPPTWLQVLGAGLVIGGVSWAMAQNKPVVEEVDKLIV
ncbi:DMT family transporter [Legionella bononiensis]|uniref:EamA family transporter n=1 Tax=Legionella bononiensis TaxID=2793102 RepID=A0ABS1W6U7_9GAMM|nr:EamA family transporter [Legionella bononiensis]MBL7525078.1 EamA family transporter [Legionella bononiensis]MBL7562803.1 EamA family transporter [Legionella bononiensis]